MWGSLALGLNGKVGEGEDADTEEAVLQTLLIPRSATQNFKSNYNNNLQNTFGTQGPVKVYQVDPLLDDSWGTFAAAHDKASIFHQVGWLRALAATYGYKTSALTTSGPGEALKNGLLICRVASWMTGKRIVGLPFADHCEPLLQKPEELAEFIAWLCQECRESGNRYIELRPLSEMAINMSGVNASRSCWFHELDLGPSFDEIYGRLHKNSFRRKIDRARREKLSYEAGNSSNLLDEFYRLLLLTRRRHRYLPQPKIWFKNLVKYLGSMLQISVARKDGMAIAALVSIRHRSTVVYKYGCSDALNHRLGGMPFLFWKLVENSKNSGATKIDLGRSDMENQGLITFKDRLGAARRMLTYYRYTNPDTTENAPFWQSERARNLFLHLPDLAFSSAGRALYRHMG